MKKTYLKPETEVIDMEYVGMLCTSNFGGDIDGDADDPAKAPIFEDFNSEW